MVSCLQFLQLRRFLGVRTVSCFISIIFCFISILFYFNLFPQIEVLFSPIFRHFSLLIVLEDLVSVRKCWRYKTSSMRTAEIKHGKSQECISEIESEVLFPYCVILERICNTDTFPGKKQNSKRH